MSLKNMPADHLLASAQCTSICEVFCNITVTTMGASESIDDLEVQDGNRAIERLWKLLLGLTVRCSKEDFLKRFGFNVVDVVLTSKMTEQRLK